ncbi:hypothetical protein BDZ97DRAFT_1929611 [Flammula alnicola]|nr:hypothetical protein BDZ97DRAFT_1929611 [Flammula alnicola]
MPVPGSKAEANQKPPTELNEVFSQTRSRTVCEPGREESAAVDQQHARRADDWGFEALSLPPPLPMLQDTANSPFMMHRKDVRPTLSHKTQAYRTRDGLWVLRSGEDVRRHYLALPQDRIILVSMSQIAADIMASLTPIDCPPHSLRAL